MSFFGIGRGNQPQSEVRTTEGGVPLDAVTRLRRMRGEGGAPLFTSDLSVSEFVLLEQMGWRPLGLVLGSSIYHVGIQYGNFYQNQELQYLTAAMYEARDLAMTRMEEEADVLGADGIVGVRLEAGGYAWAENALEFTAVGTAVKAPEGSWRTRDNKPFTSDFSVQDFYKLVSSTGYVPRELVLGNCVYHIAHQGFSQMMRTIGTNIELQNYTEAIYDARE
ncbi:MAG TPA: heavy metal-binding domain-containing protein, partial [Candidatus Elarobacter sp.]